MYENKRARGRHKGKGYPIATIVPKTIAKASEMTDSDSV